MPRHPDWNPLLKDLEQLHNLWLKKAEAAGDDKALIGSVLFGIEVGCNRIAEELARPNRSISAVIAEWRQHLSSREGAVGQGLVNGVDYGIELVIQCVLLFFKSRILHELTEPRPPTEANGDQIEEIS